MSLGKSPALALEIKRCKVVLDFQSLQKDLEIITFTFLCPKKVFLYSGNLEEVNGFGFPLELPNSLKYSSTFDNI